MTKPKERICGQSIHLPEINEEANICDRSPNMKLCGGTKEEIMMCSFWGWKSDYEA